MKPKTRTLLFKLIQRERSYNAPESKRTDEGRLAKIWSAASTIHAAVYDYRTHREGDIKTILHDRALSNHTPDKYHKGIKTALEEIKQIDRTYEKGSQEAKELRYGVFETILAILYSHENHVDDDFATIFANSQPGSGRSSKSRSKPQSPGSEIDEAMVQAYLDAGSAGPASPAGEEKKTYADAVRSGKSWHRSPT